MDPVIIKNRSQAEDLQRPSKSELKRRQDRLQELGKKLTELPPKKLAKLNLPDTLLAAVEEAHRIKSMGALRRQVQYIGRIMEQFDAPAIARDLLYVDQGARH